jgi:heat shock protein HslJ
MLLVAMTMSTLACDNPLEPSDILDQTWHLVSIERAGLPPLVVDDPSRYTLRLESERALVQSDCNSCNGTQALDESMLQVGPLACTRAFCGEDSLDPLFPQALDGTHRVSVSGSELRLQSGGRILRFRN